VKHAKVDHKEIQREDPETDSRVKRRNILKSGLAATIVFAGGTPLSVISCLRGMFSPSDDTSESS
jgi:hypothetical protein